MKNLKLFKNATVILLFFFIISCNKDDDSTPPNKATSLELISGSNQEAFIERSLTNPVEVVVKNQNGNPFEGALVNFSVEEGVLSSLTLTTDSEGKASVDWTLGETIGNQTLTISSTLDDGTSLNGSPLTVSAIALNPCITKSNGTNISIGPSENAATFSQVNFSDSFIIADVNVTINLTHEFDADLDIFLVAPSGLTINLSSDNGGSANNYTNTIFDDEAATSIIDGTAPFTGSFQPEESLSTFNGMDSVGNWTLKIVDDSNGDGGALLDWSLELCQ